ncbi:hypothetical protein [Chryseobacterium populi]|uniref:Uncharacterized protein n=1 Tax=Chryseobacterium populi TaxID=1144316 RepID=J2JP54_9FLAO|nr:hypothetical protein [Chryseobacterium populi]EJL69605.1 hypothetical protein PMI13_03178 [Chryseobacterium populi]
MKKDFSHLLGSTRIVIKHEMGDGFNYFTNDIWTYELGKTWTGRRIILSVTFENGIAAEVKVFKSFRKY